MRHLGDDYFKYEEHYETVIWWVLLSKCACVYVYFEPILLSVFTVPPQLGHIGHLSADGVVTP